MKRIIALTATLVLLTGCANFRPVFDVFDPVTGQPVLHTAGGVLFSRKDAFTIRHEWLDEANILHEYTITRNTDEKADAQVEMLRILRDALTQAAKTGATGGG